MKKILNERGLTLVEIIVTLAVLGIVIAPLMSMFVTGQKVNAESRKEYEALQLAQKYIEEIKAEDDILHMGVPDEYEDEETGGQTIGTYTWNKQSDDGIYDLIIKVTGAVVGDAESDPAPVVYQLTEIIYSDYPITITNSAIENIKIILGNDALNINVSNKAGHTVNLYIYSIEGENYTADVNVTEGSVSVFTNTADKLPPDNLLYDIEITVNKDTEEINTIYGTTVFKKIQVKP